MTAPEQRYEIRFQAAARKAIAQRLPEAVAAAVLKFCDTALAANPRRVGKSLFGPLVGCHAARRGTYRIVYRIDEASRVVHVLDVDHRSRIYRRDRPDRWASSIGLGAPTFSAPV
ncbi:type II toxin-antitoxin system RelE/ParE family toxin [Mycobacterium sp. pUA109]|uniref:type II toxin-antitoxin system RelE/ParE family toxin n=1 Tax=Mycobacterium sp. pUA109 TaxID=3238982 RepID=UPI00351B4A87